MNLEEPLPSDCCGSGCSPCVYDIYQQRLQEGHTTASSSSDVSVRTDLLSETRFKPFTLLKKSQIAESVFEFRFQPKIKLSQTQYEEAEIQGFLPYSLAQHLILRCGIKGSCETEANEASLDSKKGFKIVDESNNFSEIQIIIRAYTPITIATKEKNCCFTIFVKLYEKGIASEYFKSSSVGDVFYWRGPYGSFQYKPNSFSHVLMLSVGTGLAPMISVINSILNNESDDTIVHLKCGFKDMNHVILRNDIKKMAHFWNFTVEYYFSDTSGFSDNIQFGEQINMKKLDKYSVEEYISNRSYKKLLVLICGTEFFTNEMKNISELNFVNLSIHVF